MQQPYHKRVRIVGAYDRFDHVVKIAGEEDRHHYRVLIVGSEDAYDWLVKIAGYDDRYDFVVRVVNPEELPSDKPKKYGGWDV